MIINDIYILIILILLYVIFITIKAIKIGVKVKVTPKITVQNMVASGQIGMVLNLNKLAMKLENAEYEPEQFPGLVYKLPGTRATFLLFSNGKIVCTGTKSETDLRDAVRKLILTLKKIK